jgi:hypothetical protein
LGYLVTVSINYPDEQRNVLEDLQKQYATTRNLVFASPKIYDLMAAFDPGWGGAVPYTMLIGPAGEVLYKREGPIDALEVRRLIVANIPDDGFSGLEAYYRQAVYRH